MNYMNKSIKELHDDLISGKVTSEELIAESLKVSHDIQDDLNAFVTMKK